MTAGAALPVEYIIPGIVYLLFAVGFTAMSRTTPGGRCQSSLQDKPDGRLLRESKLPNRFTACIDTTAETIRHSRSSSGNIGMKFG